MWAGPSPLSVLGGQGNLLLGPLLGLSVVLVAAAVCGVPWLTDATSASVSVTSEVAFATLAQDELISRRKSLDVIWG